ncbi:MAG: orotidine 5'-phosphate decarboxylase [Candidatus Staskawiczbacteria bacterium]|nr:orotidine 5'-phosphate decarboxylase [Candidatus Staskawiczbacteria bacterium]
MITNKKSLYIIIGLIIIIAFIINPAFGFFAVWILIAILSKIKKLKSSQTPATLTDLIQNLQRTTNEEAQPLLDNTAQIVLPQQILLAPVAQIKLDKRKKYLHIALNSTLEEAQNIISILPTSDRILIEAGTPLIKTYGTDAVSSIRSMAPVGTYIVADNKCCDLASREVEMMANAGANASTCLGVAPIETIDSFIEECSKFGIDSIVDMMNVADALSVLKKLKKIPDVVMLHRGVDESEFSKEKQIPYYQIKQIKGSYDVLVAVAGGDTIKEIQSAIFNDADIVVVWKNFYQADEDTAQLAQSFLKEI